MLGALTNHLPLIAMAAAVGLALFFMFRDLQAVKHGLAETAAMAGAAREAFVARGRIESKKKVTFQTPPAAAAAAADDDEFHDDPAPDVAELEQDDDADEPPVSELRARRPRAGR